MLTLRLDTNLEQVVVNTAKNLGLTKSELIRKSIVEYLGKIGKQNAWEAGQEFFGKHSSGYGNLSSDRKEILKSKIRAKTGQKS